MGSGSGGGGRKKRKKVLTKGKDGWIPVLAIVDEEGNIKETYSSLAAKGQTRL